MTITAVTFAVLVAAAALAAAVSFFILCRQEGIPRGIPRPVYLPFDSWHEAWVLPPLETAEYQVTVQYERKEGGRLDEPLRIKLVDETAGRIVPIEGTQKFWETETRVGKCHLSEGHQYRVEIDADQVNELGLHHHRLEIDMSLDEVTRRSRSLR